MVIHSASFEIGAASPRQFPDDGRPEIAFVGRSNVGKSSLINMILGRKNLARTSSQPGKTRQLNFYLINDSFYFVDLPGFGYARISKKQRAEWVTLINSYVGQREALRLIIHLVDARHAPTSIDQEVMQSMEGLPLPYLVALSKTDKLSGNERSKSLNRVRKVLAAHHLEVPVVPTSAATGRGRDELLEWIATAVG